MCSRVTMWFWILLLMLEPHVYRKVHWNSIWFHTSDFWVVFEKNKSSALITISNPPTPPQWSECNVVHPFCQISGVRWWSLSKLNSISLVRHWMLGTSQHDSQALMLMLGTSQHDSQALMLMSGSASQICVLSAVEHRTEMCSLLVRCWPSFPVWLSAENPRVLGILLAWCHNGLVFNKFWTSKVMKSRFLLSVGLSRKMKNTLGHKV